MLPEPADTCAPTLSLGRINWVVVSAAEELLQIQKLKFKRGLSITLIFKGK